MLKMNRNTSPGEMKRYAVQLRLMSRPISRRVRRRLLCLTATTAIREPLPAMGVAHRADRSRRSYQVRLVQSLAYGVGVPPVARIDVAFWEAVSKASAGVIFP